MSYVTDLVFIAANSPDATQFQDAVNQHQGYRPIPLESGDHCTSLFVFHLGVDYMRQELRDWLVGQAWSNGTVLYVHGEDDPGPEIRTWDGPRPVGNRHLT